MTASTAPALSMVVPCYNAEATIGSCLDSLLAQDTDLQIVCVNDGSKDGTADILRAYAEQRPEQVIALDIPNGGSWNARMVGVKAATGAYVGFLDSDDYVDPNFAQQMLAAAHEFDADMVICGFSRVDPEGTVLAQELCRPEKPFLVQDDPGRTIGINSAMWNKIYRASILAQMESLPAPPPIAEDFLFETLFFLESTQPIAFVPTSLVNYVVHPDSLMTSISLATVEPTYQAMKDARQILVRKHASIEFLEAFDTSVFLHLGVSLNHALNGSKEISLGDAVRACAAFLDQDAPLWRHSRYLTHAYAQTHGPAYQRLRISWLAYRAGLMVPFLKAYKLATTGLGFSVKW